MQLKYTKTNVSTDQSTAFPLSLRFPLPLLLSLFLTVTLSLNVKLTMCYRGRNCIKDGTHVVILEAVQLF